MSAAIQFIAYGKPVTQGSKKTDAIYRKVDGKAVPVMHNGRVLTRSRDDNPNLESWRGTVAKACVDHCGEDAEVVLGPVRLDLVFMFRRGVGHYRTAKGKERELKDSAPLHHTVRPDVSKLTRAVEDALKGVLWGDDSQVVHGTHQKVWVHKWEREGVMVCVTPIERVTVGDQRAYEAALAQPPLPAAA